MDAYQLAMEYIRPGGYTCGIGLPSGELSINILNTVVNRKNLVTSYVGSRFDAVEALQIVADGHVSQPISVEPLDKIQDIYDRMQDGKILGRVVVDRESKSTLQTRLTAKYGSDKAIDEVMNWCADESMRQFDLVLLPASACQSACKVGRPTANVEAIHYHVTTHSLDIASVQGFS